MNDDLISREYLSNAIDTIKQTGYDVENEPLFDYVELTDLIKVIDNAPTIARPQGKLIIKHHMETCENCDSVMPMMNDYYRAKLRGCPYCLTEFTNLADMRVKDELKEVPKERLFNPYDHRGITEI